MSEQCISCPWCKSVSCMKFPCCGYLCMKCGKSFEEEDMKKEEKDEHDSGRG